VGTLRELMWSVLGGEKRTNCRLNVGAMSGYSSQTVSYSRFLKFRTRRADFVKFEEGWLRREYLSKGCKTNIGGYLCLRQDHIERLVASQKIKDLRIARKSHRRVVRQQMVGSAPECRGTSYPASSYIT